MKNIINIAKKYGIPTNEIRQYGEYIAKIKPQLKKPGSNKRLILVTAISPTPAGEGKTTISIALSDALNKIGKKSIVALREPSLGPVFGMKGGANGGGKAQIVPKQDIDLHFTGDLHAITAANNLIAASIDNEIFWKSDLNIDPKKIQWRRVVDVNDRSLRDIEVVIDSKNNIKYRTGFDITVASELMAIFCLAKNEEQLRSKIENIIVAHTKDNKPVYVKNLKVIGAVMRLLENALWPNIVQSLEGNLAIVHGGPFANIAHGCSSLIGTNTALNVAEFTVTEAGFGSDLGGEKFFDIVCQENKLFPKAVVLVASIRSLKIHGGSKNEDIAKENIETLIVGLENIEQHIKNLKNFRIPFMVAINKFPTDTKKEIECLSYFLSKNKVDYSMVTSFADGSAGAIELAQKVSKLAVNRVSGQTIYSINEKLETKIEKIVTSCYGADGVEYSDEAKKKLKELNNTKTYVCIAKTPLTFSDDPTQIIVEKPFKIHVKDLIVANGANFIIVMAGNVFRMPGLPENPEAKKM